MENIKNINIYQFSGTGNTLIISEILKEVFEEKGIKVTKINIEEVKEIKIMKDSMIGFLFPASTQSIHPFVWKFFKNLPDNGMGTKVFAVCTLNESTSIMKSLHLLLKKKSFTPVASEIISMPNNLSAEEFNHEKDKTRVEEAVKKTRDFGVALIKGDAKWNLKDNGNKIIGWLSRETPLPWISMRVFIKFGINEDKCIKCGQCARMCPVGNVVMKNYPQHLSKCEFCMRCIAGCSEKAIYFEGKQKFHVRKSIDI